MDTLINFDFDEAVGVEEDDDDNCCLITGEKILEDDDVEVLKCGHKFLYSNIKDWYSQILVNKKKAFNSSFFSHLECPYCRTRSGYLKLRPGETPLRYIHKEWKEKPKKTIEPDNLFKDFNDEELKLYLSSTTVMCLRDICRGHKWRGFSKLRKKDLVEFTYDHIKSQSIVNPTN